MTISTNELIDVLDTFAEQDFVLEVALARRLATMNGSSISKTARAIPTHELQDSFSARALNPLLPKVRAQACDALARVAGLFPLERWYALVVRYGSYEVLVYANQEGVGRFCLDTTIHSVALALPSRWGIALLARSFNMQDRSEHETIKLIDDKLILSIPEVIWMTAEEMPDRDMATGHYYKDNYKSNSSLDEQFRRDISELRLFRIRLNDIESARLVLRRIMQQVINSGESAWIDTDYGWVISAKDFLLRTDQDPNWDWRTPLQGDDKSPPAGG